MHRLDESLQQLIATGKEQGFLTFCQVNDYLPDEAVNPEKLDNLLMSLEELGLDIVADEALPVRIPEKKRGQRGRTTKSKSREMSADERSRRIDDPVRMYLTQMGEIPLLTRAQEIALAKKIEVTRKRFRRQFLECDYAMRTAIEILKEVHAGELPFDRTIKVSSFFLSIRQGDRHWTFFKALCTRTLCLRLPLGSSPEPCTGIPALAALC